MGFNVKAALLVSLAFIGGMAWLIHNVGAPVAALPSPLSPPTGVAPPTIPTAAPTRTDALEYRSPLERQDAENRSHQDSLVVGHAPAQPVNLPPLVLPPVEEATPPSAPDGRTDVAAARQPAPLPESDEPLTPQPAVAGQPKAAPAVAALPPQSEPSAVVPPTTPSTPLKQVLPPPVPSDAQRYIVQRGDSVAKIVRTKWNSDDPRLIQAFVEANPKIRARQNRILVGEELILPDLAASRVARGDSVTPAVTPTERSAPTDVSNPPPTPKQPAKPTRPRPEVPVDPRREKPQPPAVARQEQPAGLRPVRTEPDATRLVSAAPSAPPSAVVAAPPKTPPSGVAASTERRAPRSEPAAKSVKKVTGPMAKKLAGAQTAPPSWYTIQRNDSLRTIAKRLLKDERRWREIAALNPSLRDADRLSPGTRIKLPPQNRIASR